MTDDGGTNRRRLLKWGSGLGILALVGGGGVFGWQYITRPEVVDFDVTRRDGQPDLYTVTVENRGGPGGVLVKFRLRDRNNEVLLSRDREITMDGRTERQLEFPASPPEGTDEYRFFVEPTDFPERLV